MINFSPYLTPVEADEGMVVVVVVVRWGRPLQLEGSDPANMSALMEDLQIVCLAKGPPPVD